MSAVSVTSTQASLPRDQHATEEGTEDTDALLIDEMIKISEVTCEITEIDNANQGKLVCAQNSEATSNHNVVLDGGTNCNANSRDVENGMLPSGVEAPETQKEEHVGSIGHGTEQSQVILLLFF